jgi:hypothetical protein
MIRFLAYMTLVTALVAAYLAHDGLMDANTTRVDMIRSVETQRTALTRQYASATPTAGNVPTSHSASHTRSHPSSLVATPISQAEQARQQGGTRLNAGTCFGVGDHGLQSIDGKARVRVTNVGQAELVTDVNATVVVVVATWPKLPISSILKSSSAWLLCLQSDGNLCLFHEGTPVHRVCWSEGPVRGTLPLSVTDGVVLRGRDTLCLERTGRDELDQCHTRLWHSAPTPDQRLDAWIHTTHTAALHWIRWMSLLVCILLVTFVLYAEFRDPLAWLSCALNSVANRVENGDALEEIQRDVATLDYNRLCDGEFDADLVHMSQFLGHSGLFGIQIVFCAKVVANATVSQSIKAEFYTTIVMAHLLRHGMATREALDSAMNVAIKYHRTATYEALGIYAATHGHLYHAMRALHLARSTKCWHRLLALIGDIHKQPCTSHQVDTAMCNTYLTWIRCNAHSLHPAQALTQATESLRLYKLACSASLAVTSALSSSSSPSPAMVEHALTHHPKSIEFLHGPSTSASALIPPSLPSSTA